jgi:hypothetical protein
MYGLRVALPGKSGTSTEPRDYAFSSEYSTVKVYSENSGTLAVPASGSAFATISHSLGYVPMVIPYIETNPGLWRCGIGVPQGNNPNAYIDNYNSTIGTSNIILNIFNNTAGSLDVKYKCYIMGDSGN